MNAGDRISRKDALRTLLLAAGAAATPSLPAFGQSGPQNSTITLEDLRSFCKVCNVSFSDDELKQLLSGVNSELRDLETMRLTLGDRAPQIPLAFRRADSFSIPNSKVSIRAIRVGDLDVSRMSDEDIAFLSVNQLGSLIRTKKLSSKRLTQIYLDRLERFGGSLLCVVTLLRDRALKEAELADREIASGKYRGALHGIPYGIKDLFFVKGSPTTFGAEPYVDQVIDEDAEVVQRLSKAGAVLVAKLSLGALAMNDHWQKGRTKNPWNLMQGSSGSSAGSASATAAGLVAFAIGTETQGSIVSPSRQCRVTGLRPSYGRVSRGGGMELSFTMDKPGPICRTAEDCALVLAAICGADPNDPATYNRPFEYQTLHDLKNKKIGYLPDAKLLDADPVVLALRELGALVSPTKMTGALPGSDNILVVEAAAAFDELTRTGKVNEIKESMWPRIFRQARFVSGVDYLQAQRLRTKMIATFDQEFADFDAILGDGISVGTLSLTNLVGTPQIIIPWGVSESGVPISKSFLGRMWQEAEITGIASAVQFKAGFHRLRPKLQS